MTAELFEMVALPTLGLVLLVFGFAPPLVLRLILLLYPKDHEQRAELMGELRALSWKERPIWVAEQLETGLVEGLGARIRLRRTRRSGESVDSSSEPVSGDDLESESQSSLRSVLSELEWLDLHRMHTIYNQKRTLSVLSVAVVALGTITMAFGLFRLLTGGGLSGAATVLIALLALLALLPMVRMWKKLTEDETWMREMFLERRRFTSVVELAESDDLPSESRQKILADLASRYTFLMRRPGGG